MTFVPGWDGAAFDRWLTTEPDDDSELTDDERRYRDEADAEASRMLDEQAADEQALDVTVPKFDVTAQLVGEDGNAFVILAEMRRVLIRGGATTEQVAEFLAEAQAGDYDHLLRTCTEWVHVV